MSLRSIAIRILGFLRRRRRVRGVRRAIAGFADSCRSAGRAPAALLLLERLGDFIAASAIVGLVRERHPDVRLAWFGRARYREIALLVPGVDDYIEIDCYGELADAVRQLGSWQVFDLNLNGKSCACCGGSWRNLSGDTRVDTENYYDFGSLAEAFAAVAGIDWQPRPPSLEVPPPAVATVPELVEPYVVLHSESEESARNWSVDGWSRLLRYLLDHTGLSIVHVGARQAPWLGNDPRVLELAGRTGLSQLLAVVAGCRLFIGIDSGVAHIANVFRRPGLVLIGRYRRFVSYHSYTGYYSLACAGVFVVRYPRECMFMPFDVVERTLSTLCRRLEASGPAVATVGRGSPWQVRCQEIGTNDDRRLASQDAVRDVAAVLVADGGDADLIERWPGDRDQLIVAIDAAGWRRLIAAHGTIEAAVDWLEERGVRFVSVGDGPTAGGDEGVAASYRHLRRDGAPVVLDPDAGDPDLWPADIEIVADRPVTATHWILCDVRGMDRDAATAALQAAYERIGAANAGGLATPAVGAVVEASSVASVAVIRCSIDEVARTPNGEVMRIGGWLYLVSTQTPPSELCLAEDLGGGRFSIRATMPFSRLERPDVAAAAGTRQALFAGLRIEVPEPLRALGKALAILVPDHATGAWHRLTLP
ncbi:MAG: glycosyltransferase family 9 protein [Planctomycetes bacterium]|nr:glycosyltransferase family 9 protein [Planctomycetota bacterium]